MFKQIKKYTGAMAVIVATTIIFAGSAHAGADGAWGGAVTFFTAALGGGYGKVAALACLAWGIWGVFARSMINILLPVVVALAVTVGPGILTGMITATI